MEKEMAKYIVSRKDWDFASVEMGINLLSATLDDKQFENKIVEFLDVLAQDKRSIFVTDIFGFSGDKQEKAQRYRDIVRYHAERRFIYTDGRELINNPADCRKMDIYYEKCYLEKSFQEYI